MSTSLCLLSPKYIFIEHLSCRTMKTSVAPTKWLPNWSHKVCPKFKCHKLWRCWLNEQSLLLKIKAQVPKFGLSFKSHQIIHPPWNRPKEWDLKLMQQSDTLCSIAYKISTDWQTCRCSSFLFTTSTQPTCLH